MRLKDNIKKQPFPKLTKALNRELNTTKNEIKYYKAKGKLSGAKLDLFKAKHPNLMKAGKYAYDYLTKEPPRKKGDHKDSNDIDGFGKPFKI